MNERSHAINSIVDLRQAKESAETAARALHAANRRFELVMRAARLAVWEWDLAGGHYYFSPHLCEKLGYDHAELARGLRSLRLVHDEDRGRLWRHVRERLARREPFEFECRLRFRDGTYRWFRVNGHGEWHDSAAAPARMAGSVLDIDEQVRHAALVDRLAHYDCLTDIPNRATFQTALQDALSRAQLPDGTGFAVLVVDIDNFKSINDAFGHAAGDRALRHVARLLLESVKGYDTVARLGGDEFGVLLGRIGKRNRIAAVCTDFLDALRQPLEVDGARVHISASIGIARFPGDATHAETLLKRAGQAMYAAKRACQRNEKFIFYRPRLGNDIRQRRRLEHELQDALEREEFALEYQPEVDVVTHRLVGVEALVRWQHPLRGRLLPAEFIPVAEDTSLIIPIGEWVIRQVCRDLARWNDMGKSLRVAINLSPVQFIQGDVLGVLRAAMAKYGTPAHCIEVEITESLLLRDLEQTRALLAALHDLGVNISLDDFGSGYSSLAYLLELPIDTVKIDRSFIARLDTDAGSRIITRAIVKLAHNLRLHVLGEGVESAGQLAWLREFGCDFAQGFLFHAAMEARDIELLLDLPRGPQRRTRVS